MGRQPVAGRKGIDGLIAVVQQRLLREVLSGDVFLFVGRDPSRLKILYWDRDGLWLKKSVGDQAFEPGAISSPACDQPRWRGRSDRADPH